MVFYDRVYILEIFKINILIFKRNLLEIWVENTNDEDQKVQIGEKLRKILDMDY